METLFDTISAAIKTAMMARDKVALEALRGIKKEFLEAKTAKGSDGSLSDEQAIKILQKMVKQRKESAQIYAAQQRQDLADTELAEAAVIERYLPAQMPEAELEAVISDIIKKLNATGPQDMGKVMGVATKQLAGLAEGRMISEKVKSLLASLV
ncbi:MAG: GatB/YqeY domain-containing protein [Paludibacter sp.]|nr:GatB/YqeY domain-containing protein [Paludibacter sp.]